MTEHTHVAHDALTRASINAKPNQEANVASREALTHALLDIADAIRGLASRPPTITGPGVTITAEGGATFRTDRRTWAEYYADMGATPATQDAGGSPQNDEQHEPAHKDGPDSTETADSAKFDSAACLTCGHSRMGGITLTATDHNHLVTRAEQADALIHDIGRTMGTYALDATLSRVLRGILDRHTPEG